MLDFNNKVFVCSKETEKGEFTRETIFSYKQYGKIVSATYKGGKIRYGELIGMMNDQGIQEVAFNHVTIDSQTYRGTCTMKPCRQANTSYKLTALWLLLEAQNVEEQLELEELD